MLDRAEKIDRVAGIWRGAMLALVLVLGAGSSQGQAALGSQTSSPQAGQAAQTQVQALMDRVAALEQKLAQLSRRVAINGGDGSPAVPGAGMSKADEARMNDMQRELNQLEARDKGETRSVPHPNKITAPFQVVDTRGEVILDVEGGEPFRGIQVNANDLSYVRLGTRSDGHASVTLNREGKGLPSIYLGYIEDDHSTIAILNGGSSESALELSDNGNGGEVRMYNGTGKIAALMGSQLEYGTGHAKFFSAGGEEKTLIGVVNGHGDVVLRGDTLTFEAWVQFVLGLSMVPH